MRGIRPSGAYARQFHYGRILLQDQQQQRGSLFGEVTQQTDRPDSMLNQIAARATEEQQVEEKKDDDKTSNLPSSDKELKNDPEVLEYTDPKPQTAAEQLLSPLKKQLYELSLQQGGYDPERVLNLDGKKYKLHLTKEELAGLEPSVYLKSYRIKSSPKKATPFLRMLREMKLKDAVTQCHFSPKGIARDVGEMLTRGIKEAEKLGLNPDELYLSQIWVGKDGFNVKRLDFKARGKVGIIQHKWVHVRAILKPLESKEKHESQRRTRQLSRKVKEQLANRPIHEFPKSNVYKW